MGKQSKNRNKQAKRSSSKKRRPEAGMTEQDIITKNQERETLIREHYRGFYDAITENSRKYVSKHGPCGHAEALGVKVCLKCTSTMPMNFLNPDGFLSYEQMCISLGDFFAKLLKDRGQKVVESKKIRRFTLDGNLELRGCTGLTSLPDSFYVTGRVDLTGCTNLTKIPPGLKLVDWEPLTFPCPSLPENVRITDDNRIHVDRGWDYTPTSSWDNVWNSEDFLRMCIVKKISFKGYSVPDEVEDTYSEHVNFTGCTSLSSLPSDLTVKGALNLTGCTSLKNLPSKLNVRDVLDLSGCTGIDRLPSDLKAGVVVLDSGCTHLAKGKFNVLKNVAPGVYRYIPCPKKNTKKAQQKVLLYRTVNAVPTKFEASIVQH